MKQPKLLEGLMHLFFPHICPGCGSDVLSGDEIICLRCFSDLPFTGFENIRSNKTERIFYGRVPVMCAMSLLYFSKDSIVQNIMHEIKYNGNKELAKYMGRLIGRALLSSKDFQDVEVIIPLPLFMEKEKKRGYNQSAVLCEGISMETGIPVIVENVIRTIHTDTQTKKHRRERWQNVEDIFRVTDPDSLAGKNILLVDDVVTTGATLEACTSVMLQIPGTTIIIATLAIATH